MGNEVVAVTPVGNGIGGSGVAPLAEISLAPGYRFHPTDEELVKYYLTRKVSGKPFKFEAVAEIDVYKSEPWELPPLAYLKTRDQEWYFFSPIDRKYGNGSRLNRATCLGYWKATGKDRSVCHKTQKIGTKKTLVFHSGRAPDGKRTNWVMHEYRLADEELERSGVVQDTFVLCRIFHKSGLGPPNGNRYAPFVDEEWDEEAEEDLAIGEEPRTDGYEFNQDVDNGPLLLEYHAEPRSIDFFGMNENVDEAMPENENAEDEELFGLPVSKRAKHDNPSSSHANGSEDSTTTTSQAPVTMTIAVMTSPSPKIFGVPLLGSVKGKEIQGSNPRPTFDSSNLDKSLPPGYVTFINKLENEVLDMSMEKEALKIDVMRAQATINVLQSRVEILEKENEELGRLVRRG